MKGCGIIVLLKTRPKKHLKIGYKHCKKDACSTYRICGPWNISSYNVASKPFNSGFALYHSYFFSLFDCSTRYLTSKVPTIWKEKLRNNDVFIAMLLLLIGMTFMESLWALWHLLTKGPWLTHQGLFNGLNLLMTVNVKSCLVVCHCSIYNTSVQNLAKFVSQNSITEFLFVSVSKRLPVQNNFPYKYSLVYMETNVRVEHVFIWMVSHRDLFW